MAEQIFTPEQIVNWNAYEKVRKSGKYNMFGGRAYQASRLSREEYQFVMKNYSKLRAAIKP